MTTVWTSAAKRGGRNVLYVHNSTSFSPTGTFSKQCQQHCASLSFGFSPLPSVISILLASAVGSRRLFNFGVLFSFGKGARSCQDNHKYSWKWKPLLHRLKAFVRLNVAIMAIKYNTWQLGFFRTFASSGFTLDIGSYVNSTVFTAFKFDPPWLIPIGSM